MGIEAYGLTVEAKHNHDAWMMYHNALLSRTARKIPPLKKYLYNATKDVQAIDETAIIERMKAHNLKVESNKHGTGS